MHACNTDAAESSLLSIVDVKQLKASGSKFTCARLRTCCKQVDEHNVIDNPEWLAIDRASCCLESFANTAATETTGLDLT